MKDLDLPPVEAGSWRAWAVAVRPISLLVVLSPVLAGATMGYARAGAIDWRLCGLALVAGVVMQLITNLQNDVGYTRRGDEFLGQRLGLPRATAQGWLPMAHVDRAIVLLSVIATVMGLAMVALRGWPVLAIGLASLLAAFCYMGGPRPIAYTPFGEWVAFVFFGPVAVIGTDWLVTGGTGVQSALASVCIGALTAAALAVNNHRDLSHDSVVGRRTFAVTWGDAASSRLMRALLYGPFFVTLVMAINSHSLWPMLPLLLFVSARKLIQDFESCEPGTAYNAILFRTFRLTLKFAALMSFGAVLNRMVS